MMFCTKCGKEVPEGSAFCTNCGAQMAEAQPPGAAPPPPGPAPAQAAVPVTKPKSNKTLIGVMIGVVALLVIVAVVLVLVFAVFKGNDTAKAKELSLIHISEPTRLGMISYAVFCLKKK